MRKLALASLAAFALTACSEGATLPLGPDGAALTLATSTGAAITSPGDGEIIFVNTLNLSATADAYVAWGVREVDGLTDCEGPTQWAGSTRGMTDPFTFAAGEFWAELDISQWPGGEYCFAFRYGSGADDRTTVSFYIVDYYVQAGGVINNMATANRVGNGTHAFAGVVGKFNDVTVGSMTINYRAAGELCTFTPGDLQLNDAPGLGITENLRAELTDFGNSCYGTARILLLDRYAYPDFERGAIYVHETNGYDINLNPAEGGALNNWVPLTHGNVYVGTRGE
jgi:hypothetical protein